MEAIPYRIAVLGSKEVGKTAVIIRFNRDTFDTCYIPTTQDLSEKLVMFNKKWYKLIIIDTAGQSEMQSVTSMAIKSADAFIIMYSCGDLQSFESVDQYYERTKQAASPGEPKIIVVGNKTDLEKREVSQTQGEQVAQDLKASFIECSAKANINITLIFDRILELLTGTPKQVAAPKQGKKVTKRKKVEQHDACCELV
jgi:small GTP-binding protein